jgi:hypothetical protein
MTKYNKFNKNTRKEKIRKRYKARRRRTQRGGKICFTKKCRQRRKTRKLMKENRMPTRKSNSNTRKMTNLQVNAKIAAALQKDDSSYSDDAIELLQSLHSTKNLHDDNDEGLDESELKLMEQSGGKRKRTRRRKRRRKERRRRKTKRRRKR